MCNALMAAWNPSKLFPIIYSPMTSGGVTMDYLTQANYDDGSHATYTYQNSNTGSPALGLVQTCDDVRFCRPMKKIEYEYMTTGGPYDVSWARSRGENATTHQVVSEISCPPYEPRLYRGSTSSTETRGDARLCPFNTAMTATGNRPVTPTSKAKPLSLRFSLPPPSANTARVRPTPAEKIRHQSTGIG